MDSSLRSSLDSSNSSESSFENTYVSHDISKIEDLYEGIESVDLHDSYGGEYRISYELIVFVSKIKSIKKVSVYNCKCDISPLMNMYWLEKLYVSSNNQSYGKLSLKNLVNLVKLDINDSFIYEDLLFLPKLKQLKIHGKSFSIEFFEVLGKLDLTHLYIEDMIVNDEISFFVSENLNLEIFKFGYRSDSEITDVGVGYLSKLKKLKEMDFYCGYQYIGEFLGLETIRIGRQIPHEELHGKSSIKDHTISEEISGISELPNLKVVYIAPFSSIDDFAAYYIGLNLSIREIHGVKYTDEILYYFHNLSLEELQIEYTDITSNFFIEDSDSTLFESVKRLKLTSLKIKNNDVHKMLLMPKLEELSIEYCTVTNEIFKMIGYNCSKLKKLTVTSCSNNERDNKYGEYTLTGKSLKYLTKYVFPNLELLRLKTFIFSNSDFYTFDELKMPKLKDLDIGYSEGFDIKGIKILSRSKIGEQIRYLGFEWINLDSDISKLFPNADVEYGDYADYDY